MPKRNINDNPIQTHYDNKFDGLKKAEEKGSLPGFGDSSSKPGSDDVRDGEANPVGSWKNNVIGAMSAKSGGFKVFAKKKSPLVAIILTLVGGGIGIGGLLSPSLLLVNFKEVMVNKFDTQLPSMSGRTSKLLATKLSSKATTGVCGSIINIACKYSTMSTKMVDNFEAAGITVNYENTTLTGRAKPTSFEFKGETIKASDLNKKMISDPEFGAAVDKAYNPKFAGFTDKVWSWVKTKLGISEEPASLSGDTDSDKLASMQDDVNNQAPADDLADDIDTSGNNPDTGEPYTADEVARASNVDDVADDILNGAKEVAESGDSIADDVLLSAEAAEAAAQAGSAGSSILSLFKATGVADGACTAYGAMQAVGYAAKTVRALQLAKFAMLFLNVADQIKAGDAKAEDVSYLGKVLTTESGVNKKTATDSFGYRYAAYGETGEMSTSASKFLAAGGLTGKLIGLSALVNSVLGGTPKITCGFLKNPIVGGVSIVVGVGMFFVPGANIAWGWKQTAQVALVGSLYIAAMFLPAMLKDIVAGILVDKNTVGEAAGDALTSGASGIMSNAAKAGGNAPLTPEQAVAYNNLRTEVIAQYAERDRLTHSPFDATNSNTFMGMIVSKLIPYASKVSSLSGTLTSIASIPINAFSSLSPITKADSVEDYSMCQDFDYNDIKGDGSKVKIATDPYCNVMYGIPPEALDADPIKVANELNGEIDPDTGDALAGSKYEKFISDCINRDRPLGDSGANQNDSNGSECLFNNENKNYYIHYIDQRVQTGMDDEQQAESTNGGSVDPGDNSKPENTISKNKGWTLKDNTDYSAIQCADGTKDEGTYKHPTAGFTIRLCDTKLGRVASLISKRVLNMVNAAKADGVTLTGSSFRSYEGQQQLYSDNCKRGRCSPPTARPGNSQHERGLATDFGGASKGGSVWNWLEKNGSKYGYYNLPSEYWHWSMSGN